MKNAENKGKKALFQMNLFNEAESEMDPSAEEADVPAATEQPEQAKPESKPKFPSLPLTMFGSTAF